MKSEHLHGEEANQTQLNNCKNPFEFYQRKCFIFIFISCQRKLSYSLLPPFHHYFIFYKTNSFVKMDSLTVII